MHFHRKGSGAAVKPPRFAYHRPANVAEAVATLGVSEGHAKVLAGGQSLVPLLNMRLAAPKALVDINRVDDLRTVDANRHRVRIDALIRHSALAQPGAGGTRPVWHDWLPVLPEAIQCVAHPTIRNRGTSVGSLVHA